MDDTLKTVLFFGDSITHAHRMPDEVHDCYYLGSGYVNSIAAEWTAHDPAAGRRFINRGECGDRLPQLHERLDRNCIAFAPDLISILIGINDSGMPDADPAVFRAEYLRLLNRIRKALPRTKLVLLEPFGLAVRPHAVVETISRRQLDRLATVRPEVAAVAEETGALFVPLQAGFDEATRRSSAEVWALDGIHPSAAGHWLIARAWTAAARNAGLMS